MPDERLTKDERRTAAREHAAQMRASEAKKAKRNRIVLFSSIAVVVLAIIAVVAVIITSSIHNANLAKVTDNGPKNMASGGITLTSTNSALTTPAAKSPVATKSDSKKVQLQVYLDYQCPYCNAFESGNNAYLKTLLNAGKITYEIHPIAFINEYSVRAASAAGCVANSDPSHYWAYNEILYARQPQETSQTGLSNTELVSLAKEVGITNQSILSCISTGKTYANWFQSQTAYSATKGAPGTNVKSVQSTPTIIIDGKQFSNTNPGNSPDFEKAFQAALAAAAKAKGLTL